MAKEFSSSEIIQETSSQPIIEARLPKGRPWVRFWARSIDISFFNLIILLIFPSIYYGHIYKLSWGMYEFMVSLIYDGIYLIAYIYFEAILLSFVGTTPGKWLLKVTVRDNEGNHLTFPVAVKRTALVYFKGMALLLFPIYIITLLIAYSDLNEQKNNSWDRACHTTVTHQVIGASRATLAVLLLSSIICLQLAIKIKLVEQSTYSTPTQQNERRQVA